MQALGGSDGDRTPPPKPTELHVLTGTYRQDRHAGAPEATGQPDHAGMLADDPQALELWEGFVSELFDAGIVAYLDSPALICMCEQWSQLRTIEKALKGLDPGSKQFYRLIILRAAVWKSLSGLFGSLGMSPVARARLRGSIQPREQHTVPHRNRIASRIREAN